MITRTVLLSVFISVHLWLDLELLILVVLFDLPQALPCLLLNGFVLRCP